MNVHAQSQNCPRVMQTGDRIFTDPAGQYRWLDADGNPIPNAHQADFIPSGEGRFAVEVSGISMPYRFDPNGNKPKILKGKALDFFLKPIADAQITLQGKTVQTDARGEFILPFNATLGRREAVRCNKNGFYTSIRGFHPTDAETLYTQFILSERKVNFTYDAKDGGIFSQPGVWIKLPANGYVDESGKRYTGKVNLSYRSARPGDAHFGALMPGGDFLALNANGQTRALESYGFTEVLLADESGNALQLAPGVTAQLRFLIPEGLRDKAPETMPLWYMNENEGIWREEGSVQKDGLFYTGTVSHFTPWNCDDPFPPSIIKGRVVDCAGQPVPGAPLIVDYLTLTTDERGSYEVRVGAEMPFEVSTLKEVFSGIALTGYETLIIRDLQLGDKRIDAAAYIFSGTTGDTLKIFTKYNQSPFSISIDNGRTFLEKTEFDLTNVPVTDHPKQIIFKYGTDSCDKAKIDVYRVDFGSKGDCIYYDYDVSDFKDAVDRGFDRFTSRPIFAQPTLTLLNWTVKDQSEIYRRLGEGSCYQFLDVDVYPYGNTYKFPPHFFPNLTELFVSFGDNATDYLYKDLNKIFSFNKLPSIKHIYFLASLTIEPGDYISLKGLETLERVSLVYPEWHSVRAMMNIPNLKTINIGYPQRYEQNDAFDEDTSLALLFKKPTLEQIWIYNVPKIGLDQSTIYFSFPPSNIPENQSIKEIDIRWSDSLILSNSIMFVKNLKVLRLRGCKLRSIPPIITSLNSLETLDLTASEGRFPLYTNSITSIPPTISALSGTLKELILTGNPIPETERATIQSWLPNTRITW